VKKPKESPAQHRARQQKARADAAKQRAIAVAKELAKIVADELGITDALDCFTTGALGSCGATALNVVSSLVAGGPLARLAAKYWNKMDKAWALIKRIGGLSRRLWESFQDWRKSSKAADEATEAITCKVGNSFTPDTKVLMADGSAKKIEDVDIGDKVLATDPETGETKVETVTAEIKGKGVKHLVKVTVDTDGKKGPKTASVTATDGHPFWVPELGEWIDATDLAAGAWLRTRAGTRVQVTSVERWTVGSAMVHNLTVSDLHTYYVLAGATPALSHNCGNHPDERPGLDFTDRGRQEVYDENVDRNGGILKCDYCGRTVERRASRGPDGKAIKGLPDDAQIDHEIPKAQGGCGSSHNGCVACRACNRDKSAKTVEEWDDELREFTE
jgi:hypothetical protein